MDKVKALPFLANSAGESFFGYFFCGKKSHCHCPAQGQASQKRKSHFNHQRREKKAKIKEHFKIALNKLNVKIALGICGTEEQSKSNPFLANSAGDSFWLLFSVKKGLPDARHEGRQAKSVKAISTNKSNATSK